MLNVHRNRNAYYGRGEGGEGGMEVGGRGRLYTYRCSVTTRMTPAVRWTAMRAVSLIVRDKVTRLFCPSSDATDHNLFEERRAEAESNRGPSSYQPNALPLGQTSSAWV